MSCRLFFIIAVFAASVHGQMVSLPGGTFSMGGADGDSDELPAHLVSLHAFSIDPGDVTIGAYDSCVKAGACTPLHFDDGACYAWTPPSFRRVTIPPSRRSAGNPATCAAWEQACEYCRYRGKTLPTEAQWEYAARGGDNRVYAWGNTPPSFQQCIYGRTDGPRPAGSCPPSSPGLYDMTGNVWQWVSDYYQPDYYSQSPARDPAGPAAGRYRVIRGGGWYSTPAQLRTRNRHWFSPEFAEVSIGFRCAR
jgi:formylglycine-generating enzyme required for sulfatase activity